MYYKFSVYSSIIHYAKEDAIKLTHPPTTIAFHLTMAQIFASQWYLSLIPAYPALVATIAGIVIWAHRRKKNSTDRKSAKSVLGPTLTFLGLFGFLIVPIVLIFTEMGTSWSYESGVLTVNIPEMNQGRTIIPVDGAKVQWINPNGEYALDGKIDGTNASSFHAGEFRLQNGDKADVLQYGSNRWLLIRKAGVNTLISTPDVNQLYAILQSSGLTK